MKKRYIILLVAIVMFFALCIWQRNNIKALYLFVRYDEADIEKMLEESNKELEKKIEKYSDYLPRTLTPEEEARIASGELTIDEATEMLLGEAENNDATNEKDVQTENEATDENQPDNEIVKEENNAEETNDAVKKEDKKEETTKKEHEQEKSDVIAADNSKKSEGDIIRNYTAKFYSMKAYYVGQLSGIEADAKKDYASMSKEEKKNLSKTTFINKYIGYATALQNECDAEVESLLKSMKEELKAVGGDTSIIGVIRQAYDNEKAARKAYYMNMVS